MTDATQSQWKRTIQMLDMTTLFTRKLHTLLGAAALVTLGLTGCDIAVNGPGQESEPALLDEAALRGRLPGAS